MMIVMFFLIESCNFCKETDLFVTFPESMDVFCIKDSIQLSSIDSNKRLKYKLLVFYDSIGCFDCKLKEMTAWANMLDYYDRMHANCKIIFILSPSAQDYKSVYNYLSNYCFDYPIYLDSSNSFSNNNSFLYDKKHRNNTILLGKDNKVLISKGNVLHEYKTFNLINNYINKNE